MLTRHFLLLPCLLLAAWRAASAESPPTGPAEKKSVYAIQVYDLPASGSVEYAPFQALLAAVSPMA